MHPGENHQFYGIYVKNFLDNFSESNVEVVSTSIIKGRGKNLLEKIIKYLKFYCSIISNLLFSKYDLVYVHYPSYASLPILTCLPLINKPIVLNFHGTDILGNNNVTKFMQFLLKPLIAHAHSFIVPSIFFKEIVASKLFIEKEKIFVSPSGGIDTEEFKPFKEKTTRTLFQIGYVGRIDEGKGWEVLLKSCSILKDQIPNFKCFIAGNGDKVNDLRNSLNSLGITENVQFLGPLPHKELKDFYNELDIFIFPTLLQESLGLVGIEALSCGVPTIGSRIGGLKDYIIDDVNGYLFEPGNHIQLAEKILYLYENKIELQKLKSNARKSVLSFDKRVVVDELSSKLERICLSKNLSSNND
tara:strand:- start:36 stop:1109 length:1074 start_codon:yes stop_codon:yes gene_type:complete